MINNFEKQLLLQVVRRKEIAPNVIELELENCKSEQLPNWEPGSHIEIQLESGLKRQYSLIPSSSGSNTWKIAVLVEYEGRGGSIEIFEKLVNGTTILSSPPRNHFPLNPADEYFFIAGGIGITPLLKMIDEAESKTIPWNLAYLGRSPQSMSYAEELQELHGEKVKIFARSEGKRFDVSDEISKLSPEAHIYSCGPERLMLALEEEMGQSGINRVHVERFHPREIVRDEPDHEFTVYCKKSDEEIVVPADESILMAADFAGIDISGDCMEGTCGACETKVFEGEVDHRDSVLSAQARTEGDTMMICISRAKGKRLVIDL